MARRLVLDTQLRHRAPLRARRATPPRDWACPASTALDAPHQLNERVGIYAHVLVADERPHVELRKACGVGFQIEARRELAARAIELCREWIVESIERIGWAYAGRGVIGAMMRIWLS